MNTLNLIILLIWINIAINVVLCVFVVQSFNFIKKAIYKFDKSITKTFNYTHKFDKAFFNEDKFNKAFFDDAFLGIITKVDNKNEVKDKTDKN